MSLLNMSYEEVTDKAMHARIDRRFGPMMEELLEIGFELDTYYREIFWTHTALLFSPLLALTRLSGAVMRLEFPFRVSIYKPLLIHRVYNTYVEIKPSVGLMYMTLFDRQNLWITSTMTETQSKPEANYYRLNKIRKNAKKLWRIHRKEIFARENEGWTVEGPANFKTFAQLLHRHSRASSGGFIG